MVDPKPELLGRANIPVSDGVPGPEEVKRWVNEQIVYENWAGQNEKLDEDVRGFAHQIRVSFRQRMVGVYQRWKVNWHTANGNSVAAEYEDDIHVPETYKMLEAIKPRIEEALFENDPFFECEGVKDEIDHLKALTIASYIRRMLEMAEFRDYVAPTVQDALLCQVAAIKVHWERVLDPQVIREIELKFRKSGDPYYEYTRWIREQLVKEGPCFSQVDPFRLIMDLDAGRVQDLMYIGDESDVAKHELERLADLGILWKEGIKQLDLKVPGSRDYYGAEVADLARYARSITQMWGEKEGFKHERMARKLRTFDLWTHYDFKDGYDGIVGPDGKKVTGVQKVVMTLVDDVVLQMRLNPFDKKFYPYGVARLNRNGHEMMGVGPFDNAVIANASYDRFQSNVMRHYDLSISPIITTGPDSDLPDSLLGVRPGTVFRAVGDIQVMKVGDIPNSVNYLHDYHRREHEELTGATRYWFGSQGGSGDTATQFAGELQESNRRLRGYIRSYADMWRQVALIIYWMSGQFATQRQRFKVMGKQSELLGTYAEITPDMFLEDIDVRFLGLDNLHTYGQRQTGMVQWSNLWAPMLPNYEGQIDVVKLMRMQWDHLVGRDPQHTIFKERQPRHMLLSQDVENVHLRRGLKVPVAEEDDDAQHLLEMDASGVLKIAEDKDQPQMVRRAILEHAAAHSENYKRKELQRQADMAQAQQRAAIDEFGNGSIPGNSSAPAPGGMPARTQNETPGPAQSRTVARAGRSGAGQSQTQRPDQG